jgi:hypothetical protein
VRIWRRNIKVPIYRHLSFLCRSWNFNSIKAIDPGEGAVSVHINRPSSTRFVVRVRQRGCRTYKLIGKPFIDIPSATLAMAEAFEKGDYGVGQVVVVADLYDPVVIRELRR